MIARARQKGGRRRQFRVMPKTPNSDVAEPEIYLITPISPLDQECAALRNPM